MERKAKDHHFFTLPRRKHRVQKGLSEVLDVLGLRHSKSFEFQKDRGVESGQLSLTPPAGSFRTHVALDTQLPDVPHSGPFITISSPIDSEILSESSSLPVPLSPLPKHEMPIIDHFRRSRSKGTHTRESSAAPTQRSETVPLAVTKRLPLPPREVSVVSSRTALTSATTAPGEVQIKTPQTTAPPTRNITQAKPIEKQILVIQDAFSVLEAKFREELTSSSDEWLANGLSIENFLSYIAAERLRRMPPNGSRWDKILKWAEYFASSLSFFEELAGSFIAKGREAISLIFGCLRVLLQMGPTQSVAIERAFAIFNQFGLTFTFYIRNFTILRSINKARDELSFALADTLNLVVEVTITYHKSIRTMSNSSVAVEFDVSFGTVLAAFAQRKDHISNLMWTYQLENSEELTNLHSSIEDIRSWLLPQDSALQSRAGIKISSSVRAEGTCQWFERSLVDFLRSKDRVLAITGETGAGKSVLSGWISERLQRPIGRKNYQSIESHLSTQVSSQATQSALVKALLSQLLEQNVGNVALYRCLANTLELGNNTSNPEDAEDALWYVLDTALEPCKDVVLILDGFDALQSDEAHQFKAFEKLYETASKHNNVRIIILTRPLSVPFPKPTRQVTIDATRTKNDVKHLTRAYLVSQGINNEQDIVKISEQVAERSGGSLTWAQMALQYLWGKTAVDAIHTTIQEVPATINEVIDKQLTAIPAKGEGRLILSWMLVAYRPLNVTEIQYLLELNLQKGTYRPRSTNIVEDIQRLLGSLVVVRGKTLYFQNESVRLHLLDVSKDGKHLLSPAEAHRDITTRLLLYTKVCVTRNTEPSLGPLEPHTIQTLYRANPLLEYSVQNWAAHFQLSPFYANGHVQPITPELKNAFPNSTLFAQLERSSWEKQALLSQANWNHVLALSIRKAALGDSNRCVLQSSINVAKSYEKLSSPSLASDFYFQASRIGQAVLGKVNNISNHCAIASIESAGTLKQGARAEDVARKEEMLRYVVDVEKQKNGASSALATKYNNQLAQLYTNTGDSEKAKGVYHEIYEAGIKQHGEFSEEAAAASEKLGTVLYKEGKPADVVKYQQRLFDSAEKNLEVFDVRRVEITLRMAKSYAENKDVVSAEELYIQLWRSLGEYCRAHKDSSEAHERKIQVTIEYAKFLRGQNRQAEAESLLYGVWTAYQHHEAKSEALVVQLRLVADELTAMGILETAVLVLKNICGWFKSSGKQASAESVATATALVDTVQKNVTKKHENSVAKAAAAGYVLEEHPEDERDEEAETIIEEVAEAVTAAVEPATPGAAPVAGSADVAEVSQLRLASSDKLSLFYVDKQQWVQAINVCQKLLLQLWPSLGHGKIGFPKTQTEEAVKFARRLAYSYSEAGQTEQAEKIYAQLFYSARSGLRIQDALVAETSKDLIAVYQRTKQYSKALIIYQQLLESYRTSLGARHTLTIETLTTMGDFCTKFQLKGADQYYLQITRASKDKDGVISQDSMRAALRLSKIYYDQKRWEEASDLYKSLFITFTKRGKDYSMGAEVVKTMYTRYVTVLTTLGLTAIIGRFTLQYRDTCQAVYGAESQIAVASNLQLAEIYQKSASPEHHVEAIKITEQVIATVSKAPKEAQTPQQFEILAKAKRNLASLFSSASATSTTPETTAQAITLWTEQLESNKKELGVSHKSTLASLAALVAIDLKSDKPELQVLAKEQLQASVVEVLVAEKDSSKLFDAANTLAQTYISSNLLDQAWSILKSLRYQIISKEINLSDKTAVKLPETVDRRAFVFIAAFEATLSNAHKSQVTFSDVMTDLLTESILFDRYHLSLRQKDLDIHYKIFDGARLYAFLAGKKLHVEQVVHVENVLFDLFTKSIGAGIKTSAEITRMFFVALLEEIPKHARNEDIVVISGYLGTKLVHDLLEAEKFTVAYEVATCIYQFIAANKGFSLAKNMASSFKLSLFLAGLGAKKTTDTVLATKTVELSTVILRETLAACKTLEVDLVQLQASDLDNLVRLMGEQKNYTDLEWLLTQLWSSRDLQATWSATTIVSIGRRLVEVLFVHKQDAAIALCESICYNLRRTWGLLDLVTIDIFNLLSSLYVAVGRYSDALALHEEILRTEVSGDPDEQMSEELASEVILHQIELVKKIYARQGGWGEDEAGDCSETVALAIHEFEHDPLWSNVESVESWSTRNPPASDTIGTFVAPTHWEFVDIGDAKKPDYFPRWLRMNRQLSFGELAFEAESKAKAKN